MEINSTNLKSNEELLTSEQEIDYSLLIRNRELEEINKNLSLKIENLENEQLAISRQCQELKSINQSLKKRIHFLEEENEQIHNKLKFQIKEENNIKEDVFFQKEKEIYQLTIEIEQKDIDIKKAKEKIDELSNICKKQNDEILRYQISQKENKKQHITMEKLEGEKKKYRNDLEILESDVSKLDKENNKLMESLNIANEALNDKNKMVTKYNFINTEILKELEKISINSSDIKQANDSSTMERNVKEEHFLFGIHIDNLITDIKGDIIEMVKYYLNITKLKLEEILYEEIINQEQLSDDIYSETFHIIKPEKYNRTSISGNHSFDSDSMYITSCSSEEIILDSNFNINSISNRILAVPETKNESHSDLEACLYDENFDYLIYRNKTEDDNYEKKDDEKYRIKENEILSKLYVEVINNINQYYQKNSKTIRIPVFEKLKLHIRNTYLTLVDLIVKSKKNKNESEDDKKLPDNIVQNINKEVSSSWLIYPLSLHYYKLLIYINDIENSIIKRININQFNENMKKVKQLKDELNSSKRLSKDLEDKIKIYKLKRKSKNMKRLSQEFDNYNMKNLERQLLYNDASFKNTDLNKLNDNDKVNNFISDLIGKKSNDTKLKKKSESNDSIIIFDRILYKGKSEAEVNKNKITNKHNNNNKDELINKINKIEIDEIENVNNEDKLDDKFTIKKDNKKNSDKESHDELKENEIIENISFKFDKNNNQKLNTSETFNINDDTIITEENNNSNKEMCYEGILIYCSNNKINYIKINKIIANKISDTKRAITNGTAYLSLINDYNNRSNNDNNNKNISNYKNIDITNTYKKKKSAIAKNKGIRIIFILFKFYKIFYLYNNI